MRRALDKQAKHFAKGAPLEKLYPLYEMLDTFLYTPSQVTSGSVQVRDALDLKRLMGTVALALTPCILFAIYNTGLQANIVLSQGDAIPQEIRTDILIALGQGFDPANICHNFAHGLVYFLPIFLVTNLVGGFWEALFAITRKHEINEGFLVTGLLFPLTLPPTIPLWQVAVGITFGVVLGKEVFGGTGKNFLNPALTARAFLFFAHPSEMSGDAVWVAVDGHTGATALAQAAVDGVGGITTTFADNFLGFTAGSMGETSALAALVGALILIVTGIGSWRIMLSMTLSTLFFAWALNSIGSDTNPMFSLPAHWHLVVGGFAFGTVFMATDPVSGAMTLKGQFFYGALIGMMVVLIRVINPAFPEGVMLAILFGNCFAPLIDWFVVNAHIKKRRAIHGR